ncbi:MAG: hypothetical protein LBM69_07465 [Lachnospiraceae bacterium]|jgi:hypothetical protein|nr:hypothetical protein [Lachnospiraceae bacterium]
MVSIDYFDSELEKRDMYLCLQDTAVMRFSAGKSICEVFREDLLPYGMRGVVFDCSMTSGDMRQEMTKFGRIRGALISWFSRRVLVLDRKNAKKILNTFGFSQAQDETTKAGISLKCRGLTLKDDYWVKWEGETIQYSAVDLKHQSLSKVMTQISLKGASFTIQGRIEPQDIGTQGSYAKSWVREEDGIYLYKAGTRDNGYESLVEVSVSNILDKFNVRHLEYEKLIYEGMVCCKCKCLSSAKQGIVHAEEVDARFTREGKDLIDWVSRDTRFGNDFHQMNVVDYLVENSDRHGQNWGFYMSNKTGDLTKLHPLYDHNNAFDSEWLHHTDGGPSLMYQGRSKLEVARNSIRKCDIQLKGRIRRAEFIKEEHLQIFCERMAKVGIPFKYSRFTGITPT